MTSRRTLELVLCVSLLCTLLIAFTAFVQSPTPCPNSSPNEADHQRSFGPHRLSVIVPFRDRFDELLLFAPHIHKFLTEQGVRHQIHVINQVDRFRFNRGSLINVGFLLSQSNSDYIVMHDVDLLPLNPDLKYEYPKDGNSPVHLAAPDLHPRYHYPTFVGGILLMTNEQFRSLNGLSNKYWGWGLEDDEFYARMRDAGMNVTRPRGLMTGTKDTFRHVHDRTHRPRDTARLHNQRAETRKRDRVTGLRDVSYSVVAKHQLTIDGAPIEVYDVTLHCNLTATPWCQKKQ
uniref:Putative xylosylprotein beta4-galactosyltransferase n=1 Tax=Ornithodoros turicata TaxID=34597 RepID=A0A2R5LC64_9ACAR